MRWPWCRVAALCVVLLGAAVPGPGGAVVGGVAGGAAATGPPFVVPGGSAVFWEGLGGSACYRIPAIIETHLGTLLAFAVNRIDSCHDQSNHSLVLRRSTDRGASWGPVITVAQGRPPCPNCTAAVSSPSPLEVARPDGTHRIVVVFETLNNPTPAKHGVDMIIWSADDGATWGNATALTFPPLPNDGSMCGPAPGIQASTGGRELYFPLRTLAGEEFLLISADYGATWRASALGPALSECAIAFLPGTNETRLVANCRPGADHLRRQQLWTRAGEPVGNVTAPLGVVDPSCAGSVVAAGPALYVSHASAATARVRMVVQRSTDGGTTYDPGVLVWAAPSGYSSLVALGGSNATGVGLLFEAGCPRCHDWHFSQTIQYMNVRVNPSVAPTQ